MNKKTMAEKWRLMNLAAQKGIDSGDLKVSKVQVQGIQDTNGNPVAIIQTTILTETKGTQQDAQRDYM